MKKLAILFLVLLGAFASVWITRMNAPTNRPNSYANGLEGNYWWNAVSEKTEVDTNWKLSEGVPKNYIPVPGKNGIYMVVDEEGYIIGYKKGTKDENGNWTWEDIDPNIPENYEAVPGLKDVYKVTYDDGTVKYFKYIRNKDDTYAFVEVDAKGNPIGEVEPKGDEIPENYERVSRNQYAVKNDNGVTIGYKERQADPNSETGYTWVNIEEPKQPSTVELPGFDLTTDVTGTGDITGGTKPFTGFIGSSNLNESAVPTLMPAENTTANAGSQQPQGYFVFTNPQQSTTQVISEQYWITAPPNMQGTTVIQGGNQNVNINMPSVPTLSPDQNMQGFNNIDTGNVVSGTNIEQKETGTIKEIQTLYSTVTEGDYRVTYQEQVENIYDLNNNLLATNKLGKTEYSREKIGSASGSNLSAKASSLSEEQKRISQILFDAKGDYNGSVPNEMVRLLNEERVKNGIMSVDFTGNSEAYKIALCRSAMMALTGSGSKDLPNYGSLSNMCSMYGVSSSSPSENMFVVNATSAEAIHNVFQSSGASARMNSIYTQVAIAIAVKDGVYYVDEVFLK